ncbi:MAG: myb/SANT-like DNA-binding domain-containing protein [Streptococcus thermophilus]
MNQQNQRNIISPNINNLIQQDDSNGRFTSKPTTSQSRNAASPRYTIEQALVLIRLYGEYYRETTENTRVLSSRRIQLDLESWRALTEKYNEETNTQRTPKALKEKWELLKNHYFNTKDNRMNKTGRGGGPFNDCDLKIDKILRDDPETVPPCTFDSGTGEVRVHKRRNEEVERIDEQKTPVESVNKKKKTRALV